MKTSAQADNQRSNQAYQINRSFHSGDDQGSAAEPGNRSGVPFEASTPRMESYSQYDFD
jgi:hypothetical protein